MLKNLQDTHTEQKLLRDIKKVLKDKGIEMGLDGSVRAEDYSAALKESKLIYKSTVPFHSIRQSRVTGPSKIPKCHGCHGRFCKVPNSFNDHVTNIQNFRRLRR